jgi:hypothetical protein
MDPTRGVDWVALSFSRRRDRIIGVRSQFLLIASSNTQCGSLKIVFVYQFCSGRVREMRPGALHPQFSAVVSGAVPSTAADRNEWIQQVTWQGGSVGLASGDREAWSGLAV